MRKLPEGDAVVVAIDQGTSSTKVVVVDAAGVVIARSSVPLGQSHPKPGWVEQDADELLRSVVTAVETAIAGLEDRVVALGISSQRESAVVWDRSTGVALGPVLGWQDRRTSAEAREMHAAGLDEDVRASTGLPIDPMFSALKFGWLLDSVDPKRSRARAGELALGTVDSWLLYNLTGEHRIEIGNASRTQLLNLDSGDWDEELLTLFRVPRATLPTVVNSIEHSEPVRGITGLDSEVRVTAVLGDSHAALYGHGVRGAGAVKVTYGTGSSIMGLVANEATPSRGLVRTIAWSLGSPAYAFEGNILSSGSTLVWLGDILGMAPRELSALAESAEGAGGVSLVPAFAGLGAPWWDESATAVITGLTLGSTRENLAAAALESIVLQVEDVLEAADGSVGERVSTMYADGGPSSNGWLMQLQADLSQRIVVPSSVAELSALGVAHLAGESVGLWSAERVRIFHERAGEITPQLGHEAAVERRTAWLEAVARSRTSTTHEPSRVDRTAS